MFGDKGFPDSTNFCWVLDTICCLMTFIDMKREFVQKFCFLKEFNMKWSYLHSKKCDQIKKFLENFISPDSIMCLYGALHERENEILRHSKWRWIVQNLSFPGVQFEGRPVETV